MTVGSTRGRSATADQGLVHVFGSVSVYWYRIVLGAIRSMRSMMRRLSLVPYIFGAGALSLKFVVSTTSVFPSHRPRASPNQCRMLEGTCGRLSSGMMRTSLFDWWTIVT